MLEPGGVVLTKKEKAIRIIGMVICEAFALATIVMLFVNKQYDRLLLGFATPLIILAPKLIELLFRCRINLPTYLFGLFYAIGPMLGQCHNLYYTVWWWDKMLHIMGGVMFAFLGLFLFERFVGKDRKKVIMTAIFALCFSMAISVLWEFCEFTADRFFGMDMQDDTVITHINSYLLDEGVGVAGAIANIQEVVVNGTPLPVRGYIDIGLIDTMLDMLLETAGAVIVAVIYLFSKGKWSPFEKSGGRSECLKMHFIACDDRRDSLLPEGKKG